MSRVFRVEILRVEGHIFLDVPVDEAQALADGTRIPAEGQDAAVRKALAWIKEHPDEARQAFDSYQRQAPGEVVVEFTPHDATLLETAAMMEARMERARREESESRTEPM